MAIFKKTVDSILSSINKNIEDLRVFADAEEELAAAESDEANALQKSAAARVAAAERANVVAVKLEQLIAG